MNATRKVKLKDLTGNLTCHLCKGYFIDASTIIECLHSFCRACIVKHLEKSEFCPVCDVQLHSSKPLSSVRSDQMLQEIVYKLVPGLFQSEMVKRRQFYNENPASSPTTQRDSGHVYNESYITSDDQIQLSLEYYTNDLKFRESTRRYFECPAAVSISILKKIIQGKYDLNDSVHINIMYGERILPDDFLLMDIAYKYSWTQNGSKPLQLCYAVQGGPNFSRSNTAVSKVKSTQLDPVATPIPNKRRSSVKTETSKTKESTPTKPKKVNGRIKCEKLEPISSMASPSQNKEFPGKPGRKRKTLSSEAGTDCIRLVKTESESNGTPINGVGSEEEDTTTPLNLSNQTPVDLTRGSGSEVQLRISENGVISARSMTSGGEREIIISVPTTPLNGHSAYPLNGIPSRPIELLLNGGNKEVKLVKRKLKKNSISSASPSESPKMKKVKLDKSICQDLSTPKDKPKSVKKKSESTPRSKPKKVKGESTSQGKLTLNCDPKKNNDTLPFNSTEQQFPQISNQIRNQFQNGQHFPSHLFQTPPGLLASFYNPNPGPGNVRPLHPTSAINGDIKVASNSSSSPPSTDSFTSPPKISNGSSSPKKPPKFFKSRHSEITIEPCSEIQTPKTTPPIKINGSIDNHTTNGNGHSFKTPTPTKNYLEEKQERRTPTPTLVPVTGLTGLPKNTHLFDGISPGYRFPPGFAPNINMNTNLGMHVGGPIPLSLVPLVTSSYCSMPFYNNPRTTTNPTTAFSNTFSFPFFQNPSVGLGLHSNSTSNHNQPTLDLSTRKSTSNYVNISPKRCEKVENGTNGSLTQNEPLSLKMNQSQSPNRKLESRPEINSNSSPGSGSTSRRQKAKPMKTSMKKIMPLIENLSKKASANELGNGNTNNNIGEVGAENDDTKTTKSITDSTPSPSSPKLHQSETNDSPVKDKDQQEPDSTVKPPGESETITKSSSPRSPDSVNCISDNISRSGSKTSENESDNIVGNNNSDNVSSISSTETIAISIPSPAAINLNITSTSISTSTIPTPTPTPTSA